MKVQRLPIGVFVPCLLTCLLFCGVIELHAQGRPMSTVERRIDTLKRQSENYEKENMGRDTKPNDTLPAAAARQVRMHIEEDLNALQDAYNKILVVIHKADDVTPAFTQASAADVKKHAVRLKSNLALAKYEEDEPVNEARLRLPAASVDRLKVLTRLLYGFVTNPIFENVGTIDIEQSKKASKDLDSIIEVAQGLAGTK